MDRVSEDEENYEEIAALLNKNGLLPDSVDQQHTTKVSLCYKWSV